VFEYNNHHVCAFCFGLLLQSGNPFVFRSQD